MSVAQRDGAVALSSWQYDKPSVYVLRVVDGVGPVPSQRASVSSPRRCAQSSSSQWLHNTAATASTGNQGMLITIIVRTGSSVNSGHSGDPYSVTSRVSPWPLLALDGDDGKRSTVPSVTFVRVGGDGNAPCTAARWSSLWVVLLILILIHVAGASTLPYVWTVRSAASKYHWYTLIAWLTSRALEESGYRHMKSMLSDGFRQGLRSKLDGVR